MTIPFIFFNVIVMLPKLVTNDLFGKALLQKKKALPLALIVNPLFWTEAIFLKKW